MSPDKPVPDSADTHIQVSPNFTPTPGLTPITAGSYLNSLAHSTRENKVQRVYAALQSIYINHNLCMCPHMGLHYAGSYAWTDLPGRDKTPVCVIELLPKDINKWQDIDTAIREMLDEHDLGPDGVYEVPVRYYTYHRSDTSHNGDGKMEVFPDGPVNWTPATAAEITGDGFVGLAQKVEDFAAQAARTRAARRAAQSLAPRRTVLSPEMMDEETRAEQVSERRQATRDRLGRVDSRQQVPTVFARPPTRRQASEANVHGDPAAEESPPATPPGELTMPMITPPARAQGTTRRSAQHPAITTPRLARTHTTRPPPTNAPIHPAPQAPTSRFPVQYTLINTPRPHLDDNLIQYSGPVRTPFLANATAIPQPSSAEIETVDPPAATFTAHQLARIRGAGAQIPDFDPEPDRMPRMGLRELAEAAHARRVAREEANGTLRVVDGDADGLPDPEQRGLRSETELALMGSMPVLPPTATPQAQASTAAPAPIPRGSGFPFGQPYRPHPEALALQDPNGGAAASQVHLDASVQEAIASFASTPSSPFLPPYEYDGEGPPLTQRAPVRHLVRPDQQYPLHERLDPDSAANFDASREAVLRPVDASAPRTLPAGVDELPRGVDPRWPEIDAGRAQDLSLGGNDYFGFGEEGARVIEQDIANYEHVGNGAEHARFREEDGLLGAGFEGQPGGGVPDPAVTRLYRSMEQMEVRNRRRRGVIRFRDEEEKDESEADEREIDLDAERRWVESLEVIEGIDPHGED